MLHVKVRTTASAMVSSALNKWTPSSYPGGDSDDQTFIKNEVLRWVSLVADGQFDVIGASANALEHLELNHCNPGKGRCQNTLAARSKSPHLGGRRQAKAHGKMSEFPN